MLQRLSLVVLLVFLGPVVSDAAPVRTGAAVLADAGFPVLKGKKFGLVTNQSAVVGDHHLLDLLITAGAHPSILFGPEHGIKGTAEDGVHLTDSVTAGIAVRSLYGTKKKPSAEDLKGLDLMVFDMQDVGARFYTYISTLGLVMQATAEAGIPLVVLDRPNPLGGDYVAGFARKDLPASFTSPYPIPVAYGMTMGELALMIKGEGLLPGLSRLDLTVVRMEGWQRWMRWPDTDLDWIATSPNVAAVETALLYAGSCLLEATAASEGRGTATPFALVGVPGIDSDGLAARLNRKGLPGVQFLPERYIPQSRPGMSSAPKFRNREVHGIRIRVTDHRSFLPVETGVAVVSALHAALPAHEQKLFFRKGFDDLAGSKMLRQSIETGRPMEEIIGKWEGEVASFLLVRDKYLIYRGDNRP